MSRASLKTFLAALVALVLLSSSAFAADTNTVPQNVVTLNDVVRLLRDRNPKILAEREAIASARADRRTAAAYPNPRFTVNHQEPSGQQTLFTGDRQEQVSMEFPILIPGQRSSRIAKADADIEAAKARVGANTANISADALASFMRLLAAQQRSEVLSNALGEVARLKDTISGRAAQGAASAYDVTRVEVEATVLATKLEASQAEAAAERSQLATLLAITNSLPTASGALEPWDIADRNLFDPTLQVVTAPASLAAAREAAAAEAGIKVAKRNRWPDVSLESGRSWTRHPFGAADYGAINIEIPIFDTKRGPLEKARSDARAAEARKAAALAETEATIRQLAENVKRRQVALEHYRTDLEPRLARLKEMSSEAYLMGRHTILELIDAEQARREVRLDNIDMLAALLEAQVRFLALTGQLDSFLNSNAKP